MAKDFWHRENPGIGVPGSSEYEMYKDVNKENIEVIVCTVGKTVLHYNARCINDLHAMLKSMAAGWNLRRGR